jgi:signal peptidase I
MKRAVQWKKVWREWTRPLLVVVLVTAGFRSAVADWYDVPTGSMKPSILEGDRIFVNKLAYDFRIPFTTVGLIHRNDPTRGEVVVFYSPHDGKRLVKRVVGVPGDTIEIRDSRVYINGEPAVYEAVQEDVLEYLPKEQLESSTVTMEKIGAQRHPIMISPEQPSLRWFPATQIPQGYYFVMGDNRDNSFDSRWFGFVERNKIVGRATTVIASLNPNQSYLPRWHRFFTPLP